MTWETITALNLTLQMLRIVLKNGTLISEMKQKPKKGLLNGEACSPYMGYKPDSIWSDCGMKIDLMVQPEDLYDIRPSAGGAMDYKD